MNEFFLPIALVALAFLGACCLSAFAAEQPSFPESISLDGAWEIIFDPTNKKQKNG